MYEVVVRHAKGPSKIEYAQVFDAPDWQTALLAAAEVVKVDPAFIEEPDSACDLGDDEPRDTPRLDALMRQEWPVSACDLSDEPRFRVRMHNGYGHGLLPGLDWDTNCPNCRDERAGGVAPTIVGVDGQRNGGK